MASCERRQRTRRARSTRATSGRISRGTSVAEIAPNQTTFGARREFHGIHGNPCTHGMGGSWTFCRKRPAAGRRTSKTKKSRMFACCGVRHFPGITEERKSVPSFGPIRPNGYAQYKLRGYRCRPIEKRPSWNILLIVCIWAGSWGFIVAGGFAVSWQCAVRVRV